MAASQELPNNAHANPEGGKQKLFQRAAEFLINSHLGGIIFGCKLNPPLDEYASLCDQASPRAKQHVEEWAKAHFPMTHDHPSAQDSAVRNEESLGHIREVDGHAV